MWLLELYAGVILLAISWWLSQHPEIVKEWWARWRTKRNLKRQRAIDVEWNPRVLAMKEFSEARVVRHNGSAQRATAGNVSPIRRQAQDRNVVIRTDSSTFGS